MQLLFDFYGAGLRQGPGDSTTTRRAFDMLPLPEGGIALLDIGCGTGAQTLDLAAHDHVRITAVDVYEPYLRTLQGRAERAGVAGRIRTVAASMDDLPLADESFDVVWSEGAVYIMGFRRGLEAWKRLLRPGGFLVVSELSWLTPSRPQEVGRFWTAAYPEIGTVEEKTAAVEQAGYTPLGHLALPTKGWTANFYEPLARTVDAFLERHAHSPQALAVVEEFRAETELYRRYGAYYGYVFYLMQKPV